jgi:hypothetical protein
MRHPDFRVRGKIFATLAYPDSSSGTLKLTRQQQEDFVKAEPRVFVPVKGTWGQRGYTGVRLKAARVGIVHEAMAAAWRNATPAPVTPDAG